MSAYKKAGKDKMSRLLRIIPILLTVFCMFPVQENSAVITLPQVPERNLQNAEIRKTPVGEMFYTVADVTYTRRNDPLIMDLVLSMNKPSSHLRYDETGHYRIKEANYLTVKGKGELGSACAGFSSDKHLIELETTPDLFLGQGGDLNSFTIEFRLLSSSLVDGNMIFSRTGYFSGAKRGIEIFVQNRKVAVSFHNMFETPEGRRKTISLTGGKTLKAGSWYHFALSFDRQTGKLAKYINGIEDQVRFATVDGTSFSEILVPAFGDRTEGVSYNIVDESSAKIGGGFKGLIDEFRISYTHLPSLKKQKPVADRRYVELGLDDRVPYNNGGIISSSILQFPGTGSQVTNFDWDQVLARDTFIWVEFRISDRLFHENDTDIRWYRIDKAQRNIFMMKDADNLFLRGKYYQWRAHLIPSPDGRKAPQMSSVRLSYQSDNAPTVPRFLEVAEAGDGYVKLKWRKNIDADMLGYRIYYGVVPGRYDGILKTVNNNIISNKYVNKDGFVEITITNDTIEENREDDPNRLLTYPILRNTVLYYFAVSAFDNYRPGTPFNHESNPSKPVAARPFAGSEIKTAN